MNDNEIQNFEGSPVNEYENYKTLETRLYGELIRSCQKYSAKLRIISIFGILDLVKQEILDLEKENIKFSDEENSEQRSNIAFDE
jgi:hypothetical protein